jgi:predicted ArsR family transcriptional regulator
MSKIQENGTLTELLVLYQKMALQFANQIDPVLGEQVANQILTQGGQQAIQGVQPIPHGEEVDLEVEGEEPANMEKARNTARASTQAD